MAPSERLNVLLYFYSTLPQVLGALLALLGVFSVFRFEHLKRELVARSKRLIELRKNKPNSWNVLGAYIGQGEESEILERLTHFQISNDRVGILDTADRFGISLVDGLKRIQEEIIELEKKEKRPDNIDTIERMIYNKLQEYSELDQILSYNNSIIYCGNDIRDFLLNTKKVFIMNIAILMVLLAAFLFIPAIAYTKYLYWIAIVLGLLISGLSLYLLARYVLDSMGVFSVGRKYNNFMPPMPTESKEEKN